MNESIEKILADTQHRIHQAAQRANRNPNEVKLVGASKYVSPEKLREFFQAGLRCFGENRVQELKAKAPELPEICEWHFIGGLQTNKVRDAVKLSALIHSVDRPELVEEIEKRAEAAGKTQAVLVEVNIGGEPSKHGVQPENAQSLVEFINNQPHMEVHGFMAVAPFDENLENVRPFYTKLRKLRDEIQNQTGLILPELSMGMSHDFEIAIEEGSTIVRIGSALFGNRPGK